MDIKIGHVLPDPFRQDEVLVTEVLVDPPRVRVTSGSTTQVNTYMMGDFPEPDESETPLLRRLAFSVGQTEKILQRHRESIATLEKTITDIGNQHSRDVGVIRDYLMTLFKDEVIGRDTLNEAFAKFGWPPPEFVHIGTVHLKMHVEVTTENGTDEEMRAAVAEYLEMTLSDDHPVAITGHDVARWDLHVE